jgi:hypothetical protein
MMLPRMTITAELRRSSGPGSGSTYPLYCDGEIPIVEDFRLIRAMFGSTTCAINTDTVAALAQWFPCLSDSTHLGRCG